MPGQGRTTEREFSSTEWEAFAEGAAGLEIPAEQVGGLLGSKTLDVDLNEVAYWRNIPWGVWQYTLGGYQVIKKWLSYRERPLLGRDLKLEEVLEVTHIARRLAALLLLQPELDVCYARARAADD